MSFFKVTSRVEDNEFSRFIRKRDKHCVKCGKPGSGPEKIGGLTCSHFFGRTKWSTRFDVENCDTLCISCHMEWEHEKMDRYTGELRAYGRWKFAQLGMKRFNLLEFRANQKGIKRDRKMALIQVRELMKTLPQESVFGAKA